MAVGRVILQWAWIDHDITRMCEFAWWNDFPDQKIPRAFNARVKGLKQVAKRIYKDEPDEYRVFCWFIQRLRNANDRRDDLAHGRPGIASIDGGEEFECLMVPFPSRETKYEPMRVDQIERLHRDLSTITIELRTVSWAFSQALQASSGNISTWQEPDGWTRLTMANRSPKLPREHPPPPTFQE